MPTPLPAAVRCNRGFGRWFWISLGIITFISMIAMLGSGEPPWAMALLGLAVAALFMLTRTFLPRLTISPAEQSIRTRRRVVPYTAIAAIDFRVPQKAGIWANFIGNDRRPIARLAIDETLMAPASVEQWAAVRQLVDVVARQSAESHVDRGPTSTWERIPGGRSRPMPWAQVVSILDAQIAWCEAGHRSGHRRAPMRALLGRVVVLR